MSEPYSHITQFSLFHAHVYFNDNNKALAKNLCERAHLELGLKVGRFHEKNVGPHPCWSCQISLTANEMPSSLEWLEQHRQGLTIFVHALSGDDLKDHTEHVYWLGQPRDLILDIFRN